MCNCTSEVRVFDAPRNEGTRLSFLDRRGGLFGRSGRQCRWGAGLLRVRIGTCRLGRRRGRGARRRALTPRVLCPGRRVRAWGAIATVASPARFGGLRALSWTSESPDMTSPVATMAEASSISFL